MATLNARAVNGRKTGLPGHVRRLLYMAAVVLAALLPALGFYPIFIMKIMCYALFAGAFNLLLGHVGLLSFGHAAFLGLAAYMCAHALQVWGWSSLAGLVFGTLCAAGLGLVFGALSIRRSGIYFAMITLALAQMLFFFFLQAPFTGGEDGLQGIPRGSLLGLDLSLDINLYYVVLFLFLFGYGLIWRTVSSPFGRVLQGIRENEPRMLSLGYEVGRFKLLAFVISAALAGLAGASKTLVFASATLADASWQMSGMAVVMTLMGGIGTLMGPLVGAIILVTLEHKISDLGNGLARLTGFEWLATLGESSSVVIGLFFVVCVLAFRRGVVGELLLRLSR